MAKEKYVLEATFDFDGYADYYNGHGHAFASKDLVACIRFGIPISYGETVGKIIEMIMEDICGQPLDFLTIFQHDKISEFCIDKRLEAALRAELKEGVKDSDSFFDVEPEQVITCDEAEQMMDMPILIGYIHVWRSV